MVYARVYAMRTIIAMMDINNGTPSLIVDGILLHALSRNEGLIIFLTFMVFVASLANGFNLIRKYAYDDKVRFNIRNGFEFLVA